MMKRLLALAILAVSGVVLFGGAATVGGCGPSGSACCLDDCKNLGVFCDKVCVCEDEEVCARAGCPINEEDAD